MIIADYPDREALEDILIEATKNPREPISLQLVSGKQLRFALQHRNHNTFSGKMVEAPYALVIVDLNTREVTIT